MNNQSLSEFKALNPEKIKREDYLNTLCAEALRCGLVSDGDVDRIRNDLLNCLAEVIGYYTKNESSSVKAESARKLSQSMVYNIDTYLLSLGDDSAALKTVLEKKMNDCYGKGYVINTKLFEEAKVLYGKVRLTRLKDAGVMYDKTLDRYFYNYLLDYDPRFSAMDKIYLSMRKFGIDGAYHIDGAVEVLKKLYEINKGTKSDFVVSDSGEVKENKN